MRFQYFGKGLVLEIVLFLIFFLWLFFLTNYSSTFLSHPSTAKHVLDMHQIIGSIIYIIYKTRIISVITKVDGTLILVLVEVRMHIVWYSVPKVKVAGIEGSNP